MLRTMSTKLRHKEAAPLGFEEHSSRKYYAELLRELNRLTHSIHQLEESMQRLKHTAHSLEDEISRCRGRLEKLPLLSAPKDSSTTPKSLRTPDTDAPPNSGALADDAGPELEKNSGDYGADLE